MAQGWRGSTSQQKCSRFFPTKIQAKTNMDFSEMMEIFEKLVVVENSESNQHEKCLQHCTETEQPYYKESIGIAYGLSTPGDLWFPNLKLALSCWPDSLQLPARKVFPWFPVRALPSPTGSRQQWGRFTGIPSKMSSSLWRASIPWADLASQMTCYLKTKTKNKKMGV